MSLVTERIALERNLSIVFGKPVRLPSLEIQSLTPELLKRAYYRQAHEYHPDKAVCRGLDPEYLSARFRTLQDAYSGILGLWDSGSFLDLVRARVPGTQGIWTPPSSQEWRPKPPPEREPLLKRESPPKPKPAPERQAPRSVRVYHAGDIPSVRLRLAQYLYYSRRIDWETLIRSLTWQFRARAKIGELGAELGYLEHGDILDVLKLKGISELFGETAVRLGLLTPFNLAVLMGRQRLLNMPIGRYFVENGHIAEEDLELSLDSLYKHNFSIRRPRPAP
jgi:hypothetical protein